MYLLGRKFSLCNNNHALAWLFFKELKAAARISGWIASLMEYPIVIKYFRGADKEMADALSRLDSIAIDNEVPADLARSGPSVPCPVAEVDRFEARTDWLAAKRADGTILFVADLLKRLAQLEPAELELNPTLKPFANVRSQLCLKTSS